MGLGLIWTLITSRLGGWIAGGLAVLALLGLLKWERNAKFKAQADLATTTKGYQILDQGYIKLYQEREKIQAKANSQRRKLHELQQTQDLNGLRDDFNSPGGVLPAVRPNPPGGSAAAARYYDPAAPGAQYQEAP